MHLTPNFQIQVSKLYMGDVKKIKSSNFNGTDIIILRTAGFRGISDTRIRAESLFKCLAIIFNDSLVSKIYSFFSSAFS